MATVEIPQTMLAATIVAYNEPLEIRRDVKVPEVPEDRILVKIEASSLCSSDIMAHKGYMGPMSTVPYCGGHEPVGTIVKLGSAIREFEVGDRVGFLMFTDTCGICDECFSGQHRWCLNRKVQGFADSYGGFSEYSLADPTSTVKIPSSLSFEIAAPLFCAGITAYTALLKARSRPGGLINIIGCGGVGHVAVMYGKAMGYRINAYDVAEEKLQLAKRSGADEVFNILDKETQFEPALTTIVITGANAAYVGALNLTAYHGVVIAVGLPSQDLQITLPRWCAKDVSLITTSTGSRQDMAEALQIAARHNIKPQIDVRSIETINEGYKELAEGKVDGRLVYTFDSRSS